MKLKWCRATLISAFFLIMFAGGAHAQWTWLYPTPHGNNLYDVTFLSDIKVIAVGDVGTIMVSPDAGLTWTTTIRTNGVATRLNRIDRIDDNTAVAVGNNGAILKTIDGGTTWISESGAGVSDLIDVSFSGMIGIALGYGPYPTPNRMFRSTNGGDTWSVVAGAPLPAYGVDMATPMIGYCVLTGGMVKTLNGGLTWNVISAPVGGVYSHVPVSFADALHGTTVGSSSQILVTSDGGATWTPRNIGTVFVEGGSFASDLECRSPSTIAASVIETMCDVSGRPCSSSGDLFRSSNDGASWQNNNGQRSLYGVALDAFGIIIAVGKSGVVHRWIAGSWQQLAGTTAFDELPDAAHIAFATPGAGVILGSSIYGPYGAPTSANEIFSTSTAGSSWDVAYWGYPYSNLDDIAYAAGASGLYSDLYAIATMSDGVTKSSALLKSTDAGATWSTAWSTSQYLKLVSLEFSSASHGVAVGSGGSAIVINGATATTVGIPTGMQNLAFADGSVVVAVGGGSTRIIRSTDSGATWNPVSSPVAKALTDIAFVDASTGIIVGPNNVVLRTTDGGLSWSTVTTPLPSTEFLTAVSFSGNYGVAVGGYNGSVIATEDGGVNWSLLTPPATGLLSDVVVFGAHHALIAGPELTVLEYRENTVPTLFSSFNAIMHGLSAELRWDVSTDDHLSSFSITRSNGPTRKTIASNLAVTSRSFRDDGLTPGKTYEYQLLAVDRDGSYTQSMPVKVAIPAASVELLPNQPNPFNPETTIRFVVPEKMPVRLTIHDVAGRVVATLVDNVREAGMQTITWNAEGMASGVYFARLRAGKTELSRKMVLLK